MTPSLLVTTMDEVRVLCVDEHKKNNCEGLLDIIITIIR